MGSLYLHIPFCASKCPYCDFYSQVGTQQQLDDYVALLIENIKIVGRQQRSPTPCTTIFFGGGTPSLLSPQQIKSILNNIDVALGIATDAEITVEANPGTVSVNKLRDYRNYGINRLSLGVQSLDQNNLNVLGRVHSVEGAVVAVNSARTAGFDNINLDLMFALPGQGLIALEEEISALLSLAPEHISLYGLSIEPGTAFAQQLLAGTITASDETLYAQQYVLLHDLLETAGFDHYEISNFARSERRCRHNQNYWQRNECLAVGVGAHAFKAQGAGERWYNRADLIYYREVLARDEDPAELLETFTLDEAMKEYVYLALRTSTGISRSEFKYRFGSYPEEVFADAFGRCREYLRCNEDSYSFNLDGWLIYDHLISHFL